VSIHEDTTLLDRAAAEAAVFLGPNWLSKVIQALLEASDNDERPGGMQSLLLDMGGRLGVDPAICGPLFAIVVRRGDAVLEAEQNGSGSQAFGVGRPGFAGCTDLHDVLRRMVLTTTVPERAESPARWIDVRAPLDLVESTLAVRNTLSKSAHGSVDFCLAATASLGLCAHQLGYQAEWQPCTATGLFHMILRCGRWGLDPTAEQFGVAGPQVFDLTGDWPWPILNLFPTAAEVGLTELPQTPPLTEETLIQLLAVWVRDDSTNHVPDGRTHWPHTAIPALLAATNLEHLRDAIYRTAEGS
jgi:hypothetical protein